MYLKISSDGLVYYTNQLEKLNKSALPVAIRGALNDAAFDLKKSEMPSMARKTFTERKPNFFKANSRVESAKGFDIKTMVSTVGFVSSGLHNSKTNFAVRDLQEQEHGGTIQGRSFKPLEAARISNNHSKNVRANYRISKMKFINSTNAKGANNTQKLIKSAIFGGNGSFVLGGKVLLEIQSTKRVGRNTVVKYKKLFSFQKHGTAPIKHSTHFMEKSSNIVHAKLDNFYINRAQIQIRKVQS